MAAIFQIRRGSGSAQLVDGELYLHKGSGSLQVSLGETPITLARLDQPNSGSLRLGGDISASNAYFSGDVAISGNLFLGNNSSDNISALGVFTTNLNAGSTNTYNIGSTSSVWANVYATSISGAIAATNGVISGSSQIVSILDSLNSFTSSTNIRLTNLESTTASLNISVSNINTTTASLNISVSNINSFTSSTLSKFTNLESKSASVDISITNINTTTASLETRATTLTNVTSSLNTFTGSANVRLTNLELFSGSQLTQNSNLATITGSLILTASANVLSIVSLNSYTSSLQQAITASGANLTINGNLTVKGTTTQIDSTTIQIGDNIIELNGTGIANGGLLVKDPTGGSTLSGSLLWDSTNDYWKGGTLSNESKLLRAGGDSIISASAQLTELNNFTGSQLTQNSNLATISGSLISSASADRISITNLNSFSSSQLTQNTALATISGSLISSASTDRVSITNINTITASLNTSVTNINSFTSSQLTQNTTLGSYTASVNQTTSSLNSYTASANIWSGSIDTKFTTLGSYTASVNQTTSSLNEFSASVTSSLLSIYQTTSSLNQTTASLNLFSASVTASLVRMTASIVDHEERISYLYGVSGLGVGNPLTPLNQFSSSVNSFTQSTNIRLGSIEAATGSYETKGRGIVSGSSQIVPLLPTGVISGSIQILGGSTIHSSSIGNYQFNSIGVNIAPTGVAGEIVATADITAFYSSDIRLKENIQPIENALEKVNQISGNTYNWKNGFEEIHSHTGTDVGVIAQEIEQILPQIVTNRDNGFKAVQYEKIIPLLIESIKELSAKVDKLENK